MGLYQRKDSKYYWISFSHQGKQYHKSTRTPDKRLAKKRAQEIIDRFTGISIQQLSTEWYHFMQRQVDMGERSEKYLDGVDKVLFEFVTFFQKRFTWPNIDIIPANQIGRHLIDLYVDYCVHVRKNSLTTVAFKLRSIKAVLTFGYNRGWLANNPLSKYPIPKTKKRIEYLTKQEIQNLLKTAKERPLMKNYIEFMLLTGCRCGELNILKWDDITENHIKLKGKSGIRHFPINEELQRLLNKFERKENEYFLVDENDNWLGKHNAISKTIKSFMRKAGLKESYVAHSLRHTFASHLIIRGEPIYTVSKLLGHSTVTTTEIYSHLSPELVKIKTKYF